MLDILFSLFPILVLIVLLGVFKIQGYIASLIVVTIASLLAIMYFHFSIPATGIAIGYGGIKAIIVIIFVVIMAVFSYNILVKTKSIEVLKHQMAMISSNPTIQVLLIVYGLGGVIESMAGFGSAVAICMAILINLGYPAMLSALVSLLANSTITAFGSIGIPIETLAIETGLHTIPLGLDVIVQSVIISSTTIFMVAMLVNKKTIFQNILLAFILGVVSNGVQYIAVSYIGVQLGGLINSATLILCLVIISKLFYKDKHEKTQIYTSKDILKSWSIYMIIMLLIVITSPLFPNIKQMLEAWLHSAISLPIGDRMGGLKVNWLTWSPLLLFIGCMLGGYIQGAKISDLIKLFFQTIVQMKKSIITILFLVIFATIMDYSGMIQILAKGLAEGTQSYYPFVAPIIGWIGTFLTGSDTSSNVLFGKLQISVADNLHLNSTWISASNTTGATIAKIVSLQSISIATSACHLGKDYEGKILNKVMMYSLICLLISCIIIYIGSKII